MTEQDETSARLLQDMLNWCSPGLQKEEDALRFLMNRRQRSDADDIWVEPCSRLATVLYHKGHLHEAKRYCYLGLTHKPWHFEIPQLLQLISLKMGDWAGAVRYRR